MLPQKPFAPSWGDRFFLLVLLLTPKRFWDWLFAETVKCVECGEIYPKVAMLRNEYGWFCTEEEFQEYWARTAPFSE
jgi:hypothetical protein